MTKQTIKASYDQLADVLYLTSGKITPTKNSEDEAGLVLRYDLKTMRPVGATIIDYKEYWLPKSHILADRLSNFFHISLNEAKEVIQSRS